NGGRGFTVNPCLGAQWRGAPGVRGGYFHSGYDPPHPGGGPPPRSSPAPDQAGGGPRPAADAHRRPPARVWRAPARGRRAVGADRATMIWLDVESSNSWDPVDLDLNRTALQAEIDELAAFGRLVGLYATFAEWRGIVGDWSPAGIVADWVAGASPAAGCAMPG